MHTGRKRSAGRLMSSLVCAGFSLSISVIMAALIAGLILNGRIGEGIGDRLMLGVQLIAVIIGCEIAKKVHGAKDIPVVALATGVYAIICGIGGLVIDGKYQGMWLNVAATVVGFLCSCALCIRKTVKSGKRKKRVW